MVQYSRVILVARKRTDRVVSNIKGALLLLKQWGVTVYLDEVTGELLQGICFERILPYEQMVKGDLLLTFGGDGSFLNGAHLALDKGLAILGVNCGSCGFLSDIQGEDFSLLQKVFMGENCLEERGVLSVTYKEKEFFVINEIAIFAYNSASVLNCLVKVDDVNLASYKADGIIVAAPTGTTGHALSAGGAVLSPSLKGIEILPVLSQNLKTRPVIVDEAACIELFIQTRDESLSLIIDGCKQIVDREEKITIKIAENRLHFLHRKDYNFYQTLGDKLGWN